MRSYLKEGAHDDIHTSFVDYILLRRFIVNASMFRPEKQPEANIDGRRVTFSSGRNHLAGYHVLSF